MDILPQQTQRTEPDALFHLAIPSPLTPAPEAALPDRVNDLPAFYYWKDAIVVGSYVHPVNRFSLDITRDRRDGFGSNFNRMRDNGVGVPILMDHAATAESTPPDSAHRTRWVPTRARIADTCSSMIDVFVHVGAISQTWCKKFSRSSCPRSACATSGWNCVA